MKPFFILLTGLIILHVAASGQLIYMSVDGALQGKFKGESSKQMGGDKGDKIEVFGTTMEVLVPTEGVTVTAARRRQHQPFTFRKASGVSSPQFFQAAVSNEALKRIVIEFVGTNANGEMSVYYTITLENARVTDYKQVADVPPNGKATGIYLFDEIKITYQKITVESNAGKTMSTDDAGGRS